MGKEIHKRVSQKKKIKRKKGAMSSYTSSPSTWPHIISIMTKKIQGI
jgi:hypothetical protein